MSTLSNYPSSSHSRSSVLARAALTPNPHSGSTDYVRAIQVKVTKETTSLAYDEGNGPTVMHLKREATL